MEKTIRPVEIIVDLYELRNTRLRPMTEDDKWDRIHYDFQYSAISTAIACIANKYKVKAHEIDDEIKERRDKDELGKIGKNITL